MNENVIQIKSTENPHFIDLRIKRNGEVYSLKVIGSDGLVVKKQFDSIETMAIEVLELFGISKNTERIVTIANA